MKFSIHLSHLLSSCHANSTQGEHFQRKQTTLNLEALGCQSQGMLPVGRRENHKGYLKMYLKVAISIVVCGWNAGLLDTLAAHNFGEIFFANPLFFTQ